MLKPLHEIDQHYDPAEDETEYAAKTESRVGVRVTDRVRISCSNGQKSEDKSTASQSAQDQRKCRGNNGAGARY